jgi:hypothetical protein
MGANDVMQVLSAAGLTVTADGDRLMVSPAELLTDDLRNLIRSNKGVLLRLAGGSAETIPGPAAENPLKPTKATSTLPTDTARMFNACVAAGLYAEDERAIVTSMNVIDADSTRDLVMAMHERIDRCYRCRHLARPGLSNGHCAGREDLPRAYGEHHPLRLLPADRGAACGAFRDRDGQ